MEFKKSDLDPVKSFQIQDELNPKVWKDGKLDKEVRENLLKIAEDFFNSTDLEVDVVDIALCGSLSNYNWSEKYSDYDLHIIINYKDIDDNLVLVEKICDLSKKQWNQAHNIKIKGYDVEVAIQDENDLRAAINGGRMGGVYSIKNDKWIKKPEKVDFEPDEKLIAEKGKTIMMEVDDIQEMVDKLSYDEVKDRIKKVWEKIKKLRERALEEEGEFGIGNILFKFLRRNNYLGKVMKMKQKAYDKQFESKSFSFFTHDKLTEDEISDTFGFNRDDIDDAIIDVYDNFSDWLYISTNFSVNGTFIDNKNLSLKNINKVEKLECQVHFFMDGDWCGKLWDEGHKTITEKLIKIDGKPLTDLIKENINFKHFENLGYKIISHNIFTQNSNPLKVKIRNVSNQIESILVGPTIYSISITKKIGKQFEEFEDDQILNFLYQIEAIDRQLQSDESWSQYINWSDLDEEFCKIILELGSSTVTSDTGYSVGWSEVWEIYWGDPEWVIVNVYGSGEEAKQMKFNSFGELLEEIKEEFGL